MRSMLTLPFGELRHVPRARRFEVQEVSAMHTDIQNQTPDDLVEAGTVIIDGLPGVALTLTPEVAEELAARLATAAVVAFGQRSVS